jgi:hypothetical protein
MAKNISYSVMTNVQNILMTSENNHKNIKGVNENREN